MHHTAITTPSPARCLADLRWLLQSPPLLNLSTNRFTAQVQRFSDAQADQIDRWLAQLDSAALHAVVTLAMPSKAPMRLGRYAECLMAYFLQHTALFELIAANLPLRRAATDGMMNKTHTTVGEFDYLLRDSYGIDWHWELAVKFYLCHTANQNAEAHDFKGPAGKDTLGLKLSKVFDKQLQHCPPPPYDTVLWRPAAYARGWMFYPFGAPAAPCDALNPHHLRGWWLSVEMFQTTVFESAHFVHLPRLHWLAPYVLNELTVLSQIETTHFLQQYWLNADAKQAQAGQMIACVAHDGTHWRELSRGFVLPSPDAN